MPQTSLAPFWKALTKFYCRKSILKPFNGPDNFNESFSFSTVSTFFTLLLLPQKCYNFSMTI